MLELEDAAPDADPLALALPDLVVPAAVPVVDRVVGTAPGSLRVELADPAVVAAAPAESFSAPAVMVMGNR